MELGEWFNEKVKVFRCFNRIINKPVIEEIEIAWQVVEVYDEGSVLAKNKYGELKMFLIR